jgi:hypothetical protein
MTYGNLVLTLLTVKERAAYVTREISVRRSSFVLFLIKYRIRKKQLCNTNPTFLFITDISLVG